MTKKKIGDFIGHSDLNLHEAIQNALEKAGEYFRFEVIESQCSQESEQNRQYKVTLATFSE